MNGKSDKSRNVSSHLSWTVFRACYDPIEQCIIQEKRNHSNMEDTVIIWNQMAVSSFHDDFGEEIAAFHKRVLFLLKFPDAVP